MIQKSIACWPMRQCTDARLHVRRRPARWDPRQLERLMKRQSSQPEPSRSKTLTEVLGHASTVCPSITISPARLDGLPCITGTRIPVHLVLWAIEHRGSVDGAIEAYPDLTAQQVKDALYFAEIVMGSKCVLDETAPVA